MATKSLSTSKPSAKNNHYIKTQQEINNLITSGDLKKAYDILSEELRMPYIPSEYEHIFSEMFMDVNKKLFASKDKDNLTNNGTSIETLKILLMKDSLSESETVEIVGLSNVNLRLLDKEIRYCLNNAISNPILKTEILVCLKAQSVVGKYFLNKDHEKIEIDITNMPYPEETQILIEGKNFLKANLINENDETKRACNTLLE